eukprot:Gb_34353 [translate_table: standard]
MMDPTKEELEGIEDLYEVQEIVTDPIKSRKIGECNTSKKDIKEETRGTTAKARVEIVERNLATSPLVSEPGDDDAKEMFVGGAFIELAMPEEVGLFTRPFVKKVNGFREKIAGFEYKLAKEQRKRMKTSQGTNIMVKRAMRLEKEQVKRHRVSKTEWKERRRNAKRQEKEDRRRGGQKEQPRGAVKEGALSHRKRGWKSFLKTEATVVRGCACPVSARIDYAACSKGFLSQVIDAEIIKMLPKSWSDHAAILITLKEQPVLPLHHIPDISSRNMKRYKEDQKQKKLTALFSQHSLKSMPAHQKECASTEDEGGYTSINKIESARNMGTDLRKGGNIETLNEAASSNSKLENIDVGPLDGSKAMGPAHLSTTLMNKHPLDINNSNGSELAENVQFNQKHLGKLDSNGTAVNANGNHHSKEEQQSISSNITVSSLDYLGVAVIGKESENLTVKLNSLARDTSHSKGPVLQKILKEPLCRTEEKSKGSKKRKAEGKHLSGPASKQKGLESYFRTQNG